MHHRTMPIGIKQVCTTSNLNPVF